MVTGHRDHVASYIIILTNEYIAMIHYMNMIDVEDMSFQFEPMTSVQ